MWDFLTGKLKRDLQFQADEQFMMHDTAVLALAFSRDSELLASASQDGKIKVPLACTAATVALLLRPAHDSACRIQSGCTVLYALYVGIGDMQCL